MVLYYLIILIKLSFLNKQNDLSATIKWKYDIHLIILLKKLISKGLISQYHKIKKILMILVKRKFLLHNLQKFQILINLLIKEMIILNI
jgi:hypothetical protein